MTDYPIPPSRRSESDFDVARNRIIEQARQLEIDFFYSAKSHYKLSLHWDKFGFWLGLSSVIVSSLSGLISLTKEGLPQWLHNSVLVGIAAILVSCLTAIVTFTKAADKANLHKVAGNRYNALRDRARQFYSVECYTQYSIDGPLKTLEKLTSDKDKANSESPPIPEWAYKLALHERPRDKFEQSQFKSIHEMPWNIDGNVADKSAPPVAVIKAVN